MNNKIKIDGHTCTVEFGKYPNGTIGMDLMDSNGEPYMCCTVNWEQNFQGDNYATRFQFPVVVIKNYSENEGIVKKLEDAGVITIGGAYMAGSGGTVEVHGLTDHWQAICTAQLAAQPDTDLKPIPVTGALKVALTAFKNAAVALNTAWNDNALSGEELINKYPFPNSFDELVLDIIEWEKEHTTPAPEGWKLYGCNDEKVLDVLGHSGDDIEQPADNPVVGVYVSNKGYWIALHADGKHSTEAMRESEYGDFNACVKCIEETMGEKVN